MLRFTVALLIACTLQVWPVPASAEMRQFANIVYELPKGWRAGGKSDGRLELRHDDDHCRNCRILLDPGVEGGGPVAEWRDAMATPGKDRLEERRVGEGGGIRGRSRGGPEP